ncbi:uncharacterized protein DEA37_0002845 [Paragonimus westermani]|uniref:CUB domain-containing protein n=1 Tax=Paragonimus westermani TaxID=34504 RepID=A0A5J4P005_9TREM|nr:uncharacterized protein DEA37_0002845 [Paragonimus westermani]
MLNEMERKVHEAYGMFADLKAVQCAHVLILINTITCRRNESVKLEWAINGLNGHNPQQRFNCLNFEHCRFRLTTCRRLIFNHSILPADASFKDLEANIRNSRLSSQVALPFVSQTLLTTNLTTRPRINYDHGNPQLLQLEEVQRWKRRRRRDATDVEAPSDQDPRCTGFVQSAVINTPPTGSKDHSSASMVSSLFGRTQKRSKEYRFQTPNYPDFFPHDMQCIKIISAPSKDHRILLNFRGLWELEKEPHCTCDFLEVRDGAFGFSPLLGRYCGRQLPNVGEGIQSTGPYMWLRFRSDSTLAHRGFQAVYRFFQVEHAAYQTLAVSACRSQFKQFLVFKAERLTRMRT